MVIWLPDCSFFSVATPPHHSSVAGPDLSPRCLGSGSGSGFISYSSEHKKINWKRKRENLTQNTFCVGPIDPPDKENQVNMYKKQCCGSGYGIRYLFDPWIRDPE